MRLHLKAVLTITGLLVATTVVLSLLSVHFMRRALREEVDRRGQGLAEQLAHAAEYSVLVEDLGGLNELMEQNREQADLVSLTFENSVGVVLASWSPASVEGSAVASPSSPSAELAQFVADVKLGPGPPAPGMGSSTRVPTSRTFGRVRLQMSYRRAEEVAAQTRGAMAWAALPVAALGLLTTLFLVRRAVAPLQRLARGLGDVSKGRFEQPLEVPGRDEIGQLASAFNLMLQELRDYRIEVSHIHATLEGMVRRRTRELEEVNRELVVASRTKSEFLANMSHELRTPLNAILGFLGLVVDGQCVDEKEEKELLRDAQQGARHLLSIINTILDLAKIETGKMSVHLEEIMLVQVFEEVRALLRAQAEMKKIDLSFDAGGPAMPSVCADAARLKQVMVNLVGNALKFTEKGSVRVRAFTDAAAEQITIEVADTGIGIAPNKHHLLFQKFQQLDGTHTRKHGGTGLGLAICRSLVEMMGGRIWVTSPGEGRGTTVGFALLVFRGARPAPEAQTGAGHSALEVSLSEA